MLTGVLNRNAMNNRVEELKDPANIEKGLGVVSLGSKMIDPPVVKRAERTIKLAVSLGKLAPNWRDEFLNPTV